MALRDVVSYLISAEDRTRAATQSARSNLQGLRTEYDGLQRSLRAVGGLTAGFLSVAGIKEATGAIVETRVEMERMRNTLAQGVGAQNVAGEITFLRKAAEDFGQSFTEISASYAKFAAATRGTAIEGQATRDIFLAVSKASTVLGLSAEQTQGALNALQQMVSKGTVSAEELRGQFGERIPGAFGLAARAMGVTTQELGKLLETGSIAADDLLPRLASVMETEFGPAFDRASQSAAGAVNRLRTAWDGLKETTASSFVGDAAIAGITLLSKYLNNLNDDINAVKLGMLSMLGTSKSALSVEEIGGISRALRTDPGSLDERRLQQKDGAGIDPNGEIAAAANLKREQAAAVRAGSAWDDLTKKYRTAAQRQAEVAKEIRATGLAAGKSEPEIRKLIAAATPQTGRAKQERIDTGIDREKLQADVDAVRSELESLQGIYQNHQSVLDAQRSANIIGDEEYYTKRKALMNQSADAQIEALREENNLMQQRQATGRERIDLDSKIASNLEDIQRIQANAYTQGVVLSIQQADGIRKVSVAFAEARASAKAYLDTLTNQQRSEIEGIGLGQEERGRRSSRAQIEDRYSQQRQQLESERRTGALDESEYDRQLDLIREFQAKALDSYDRSYGELKSLQQSASLGASEALTNYVTEASNSFAQTEGLVTNSLRSLEDAFVEFAKTGKLNFKSMTDSIVADLARIAAQKLIVSIISSFGKDTAGLDSLIAGQSAKYSMATGTNRIPYDGYKAILHKDEAVVPAKYNPAAGGTGGQVTIVQHINFNGDQGGGGQDPQRIARMVGDVAVARINESQRRNGPGR